MSEINPEITPVKCVDLTGEVCPMTFVKAKLHMEQIAAGGLIEFILKEGEHMRDVPRSLKDEGHHVEKVRQDGNRYYLLVRKRK